jgi:hypothetical protein
MLDYSRYRRTNLKRASGTALLVFGYWRLNVIHGIVTETTYQCYTTFW